MEMEQKAKQQKLQYCIKAIDYDNFPHPVFISNVSGTTAVIVGNGPKGVREDSESFAILESYGCINWWKNCFTTLCPIQSSGSVWAQVSLVLWEFVDMEVTLSGLIEIAVMQQEHKFKERFLSERLRKDMLVSNKDWVAFTRSCQALKAGDYTTEYFSFTVQPMHLFILCNVLARPIVVIDSKIKETSVNWMPGTEEAFTGVYLPILVEKNKTVKHPLVLAKHLQKFLPLVKQQAEDLQHRNAADMIPLVESDNTPLPVRFLKDEEVSDSAKILNDYLDVKICKVNANNCPAASLKYESIENIMMDTHQRNISRLNSEIGNSDLNPRKSGNTQPCGHQGKPETRAERTSGSSDTVVYQNASAPSHSIVTLNSSFSHPEGANGVEEFSSMLPKHCDYHNCKNFVSVHTDPFCYDHVNSRNDARQEEIFSEQLLSVMEENCHVPGCEFKCSTNTYPYCYEHIQTRRQVSTASPQESVGIRQPIASTSSGSARLSNGSPISLTNSRCSVMGCTNYASANVYPYCHEHSSAANKKPKEPVRSSNSSESVDARFTGMLHDLESRTKGTVKRCKKSGCNNFGNSKCQGYCHGCFTKLFALK